MANNSSMNTAGANNSMANTGVSDQSITSTAVADSSITNAGMSNNSSTAMPNNSIKDEADEYFNTVVQFEMKVDEQPKKLSKYSRYMCGMCIKYFDKRSRLRTHLSRHHDGTNSNLCCICGWFNTKVDISAHMRSVHPWYQQCDQCQKWLSSKCRLNLHMVQIHTPTVERLRCHFCNNSFIRHKTLATHMHKFHMLFQCLECKEYFAEDEDLDEHRRKCHSRVGPEERGLTCKAKQTRVNECLVTSTSQDKDAAEEDVCASPDSLSLVESLPVDQYSNHMETCSAVQSILAIPVTEQSHQLPHSKQPFTTPSELINCNHRQRQGFVDGESRNKETQVCQQSEASALEQQYEESHISRDHSYIMSREPSDVISKCPSDLVTKGCSDVMSEDVSGIISTGPTDFSTTGQSGNSIMESNDLNESSSVVISHEEVNSGDKVCNSCDKEDNSNCEDSSNCSNEKNHNVCNEDNNICQEDNSINEGNNSCDADCSEDNPSNNSSDKVREGHSFDSLEEDEYMDADQELELPGVQTGAYTSHSRSLEVLPTGRQWKQVRKQGLETNSGHNVTCIRSKGCCSLSCAALKGRYGTRSVHYMCGICHQIFENCEGLQHHKEAQHSLRCAACGLVCSRMIDLLTHYESCYG